MPTINQRPPAVPGKFNLRPAGERINAIIIHCTEGATAAGAFTVLDDPAAQASWHYTVDRNGTIYQHVAEISRAWHAGESYYAGLSDWNDFAIGIELVGTEEIGYTDEQYASLIWLVRQIVGRWPIRADLVVAHSAVAIPAGRKADPGPLFDWSRLRAGVPSLWPPPPPKPIPPAPTPPAGFVAYAGWAWQQVAADLSPALVTKYVGWPLEPERDQQINGTIYRVQVCERLMLVKGQWPAAGGPKAKRAAK